ncbi:MAG: FAD-dependent oxidoreductase [Syntrophorhabdaceae bacterium]|nr:FAD-dependent oxidoreductase [Syntrophorhabdaceae bacterium]
MIDNTELAEKVCNSSMFRVCEQCGSCSSACPLTGKNGFNVRRMIRHLELDLDQEIADTPAPWLCTTCGRCEEACPNGIKILDIVRYLRRLSPDKWVPAAAPCVLACPAHINIPEYLRLASEGRTHEAYMLIREKVPFPGILGRVCTRFCEQKCKRADVNGAVAICALKRYIADSENGAVKEELASVDEETGRKVAIVGAGPCGLTTAFYLRKKGHSVTVFEERDNAGGMLWTAIPAYRLPHEVVGKEIQDVLATGIELKTGQRMGRDFNLNDLQASYDAVFIATGGQLSRKIELEGSDLAGVLWGVDFLYNVKEGKINTLPEKVTVIGGGNVAIDVALTALRLGAKEVILACLEKFEEMPSNAWEIEQAVEEGVKLMTSYGPLRVLGEKGRATGISLRGCTSVFDAEGRFNPVYDDAVQTTVAADVIILAIGQAADLSFASGGLKAARGLIAVDEFQQSSIPGVFAGGDVAKAPGTIIEAIVQGRVAASSIDWYLGGDGVIVESFVNVQTRSITERREKGFADRKRAEPSTMPVNERKCNFKEVENSFDTEHAVRETQRCFGCDLEIACSRPSIMTLAIEEP